MIAESQHEKNLSSIQEGFKKGPKKIGAPGSSQDPKPKSKGKGEGKGKEEVRSPKESFRARVTIKPERAKTTKREIVAPRATRTILKDLATRTQVTRVFASFGPKVFVGVKRIAPINMKVQEHLHQLLKPRRRHQHPRSQAALFGLVTCPVALCMLPTASCAFPAGGNAFAALNLWFLTRSIPTAGGRFIQHNFQVLNLPSQNCCFGSRSATAKGALLLAVSCWLNWSLQS